MSNKQFSVTIKAVEVIEQVPKRSRSKFVSDAIIYYSKKKGVMDDYLIANTVKNEAIKVEEGSQKIDNNIYPEPQLMDSTIPPKKKVKVDDGF